MTQRRGLPHRVGGDLALDLANTVSWRGTEREVDHLADADELLRWGIACGLVTSARDVPQASRRSLVRDVRALRAAILAAGAAIANGDAPPPGTLAIVRDLAARTLRTATVEAAPARLRFIGSDRILGPLAWAAFDLLRGPELSRLKQCPANDCRWLFLDRSKNGSRRWCDMATCGNRAKKEALQTRVVGN